MKNILHLIVWISFILLSSCEKDAGEGGMATIDGTVIIEDYNFDFTIFRGSYPAQDYDVYIIYGDDEFYSDKVETSYNGYFEFKYLREGKYTLFAYSKDKTLDYKCNLRAYSHYEEVNITSKRQKVTVEDMIVIK